jgi:hypothetical protein
MGLSGEQVAIVHVQGLQQLKFFLVVVEHGQPVPEHLRQRFHVGIVADQPFAPRLVGQGEESVRPDHALLDSQPRYGAAEALVVHEVPQVDTRVRSKSALTRQFRDRRGHPEVPERIAHPSGVPPKPENLVLVEFAEDRILSRHLAAAQRLGQGRWFAQQDAVPVNPFAGHSIQTLGQILPFDLDRSSLPRRYLQPDARITESVLGQFVAVAADEEEQLLAHQAGFVDRRPTAAVRHPSQMIDRLKFDQRHAAPGLLVHHADAEVRSGGGGIRRVDGRRDGEQCQTQCCSERTAGCRKQ